MAQNRKNIRQRAMSMMTVEEVKAGISPFDCKAWIKHKLAIRNKELKKWNTKKS